MALTKYVDALPIPMILEPKSQNNEVTKYEVEMTEFFQKLHKDLPETLVWGYEGTYPGPTIEVKKDERIQVKWINNLPVETHLLPVDTTIHGADHDAPTVRTVVHLHGANVTPESDGYPEAWFTNNFDETGPLFVTEIYEYLNQQLAATLWYHDHGLGITRLNVYAGLAGFYIIRDDIEESLNLPKGAFEVPILIQDRSFNEDGSLFYPTAPDEIPTNGFPPLPNPSIVPEFFGDTIVVNGKVWPFLEVEPRKYRFRFLNGSNSRFYNLMLDQGTPWFQIGTDGGLLETPVQLTNLILSPAERADVIIDFSNFAGKNIIITNTAPTPFPDGDPVDPDTTGQIMQFRVTLPLSSEDTSEIPTDLTSITWLEEGSARKTRDLTLEEGIDEFGRLKLLLNGLTWEEPITEKPRLKTTEIWRLINITVDTHPIHLHLVQFQILDRRPFDVSHFEQTGEIVFTGPAVLPMENERGWKDTVRANPNEVTRIISRFVDFPGLYVWHCHILEHEDHEMMRPYKVIKRHLK